MARALPGQICGTRNVVDGNHLNGTGSGTCFSLVFFASRCCIKTRDFLDKLQFRVPDFFRQTNILNFKTCSGNNKHVDHDTTRWSIYYVRGEVQCSEVASNQITPCTCLDVHSLVLSHRPSSQPVTRSAYDITTRNTSYYIYIYICVFTEYDI